MDKRISFEGNCYMYLDMVRIGEKVMESCWYSLCVYKKKKRHKSKFTLWKEKKWKVEKKKEWKTKEVHNEVSISQD